MNTDIIVLLITLLFSAFFSGVEIAFVTSNKLIIEIEKKKGLIPAHIITFFIRNQGQFIATMLVGNNIALVVYGIYFTKILDPYTSFLGFSPGVAMLVQTLISTIVILFTGEFLPKSFFRNNSNLALNVCAIPAAILFIFLWPIAKITSGVSNLIIRYGFHHKIEKNKQDTVFGKIDIDHFLNESQKNQEFKSDIEHEIQIFQNALDFSDIKLRECSIPRTEIIAVDVNTPISELTKKFIETGLSKILVYDENIDNTIGYVHSSEMFKNPNSISEILHKLPIVPETMPAHKLMQTFNREHRSIALVVDEFGGTAGLVTLEDIMEEIFGEIEDEHDNIELTEKVISEDEFVFSGRLEIDYLNQKYNLNIPENEYYETLTGFIFFNHENVPIPNQVIKIDNFTITIIKASANKVDLVNLKINKE